MDILLHYNSVQIGNVVIVSVKGFLGYLFDFWEISRYLAIKK